MLEYLLLDWREYKMPVYPIAVISYGQETRLAPAPLDLSFPNKKVLHFDFDVIDLPRMEAQSLSSSPAISRCPGRVQS
jgi:hypothetical protein